MHERDDEYEGQDDGEYHFSDDQANYEVEPEVSSQAAPPVAPKPAGPGGNQFRRPIIGVGIFLFLIFLVYKILAPATAPTADFSQNTVTAPKKVLSQHEANMAAAQSNTPAAPATTTADNRQPAEVAQQAPITVAAAPVVQQQLPPQQPVLQAVPQQAPGQGEMSSSQASNVVDKLLALQEQDSKLINQLEAESAQKAVSTEAQESSTQGKLQDMSMRINSIEATLTRLGRAIQEVKGGSRAISNEQAGNVGNVPSEAQAQVAGPSAQAAPVVVRPAPEPKSNYAVQAIIPGRAWLKSESGETVTVAEGDTLKNYGRITKIDPYDGVVQIDVGGRTVSLSYGVATE